MTWKTPTIKAVGPVLSNHEKAAAIIAAIKRANPDADVQNRGSYLRVLAPHECILERCQLEQELGDTFIWPQDLEAVLLSSKGEFKLTSEQATWR